MTNNKTKKYFKAGLAAAVVVSSGVAAAPMATQAQSNETISFTDLNKDHLFYNDIMNLVERGIVVGFPDRTFGAEKQVTRGQAAVILSKILNLDTVNVTNPGFIDVPKDHRYYGAIAALANAEIIVGYENKYNPDAPLTRNAMAKIIALGFGLEATETAPFKDMDNRYKEYISALYENGVTLGKSETVYDGKSLVSRGQMAAFAVRADKIERDITFDVSNIESSKIVTSKGDFKSDLSIFNAENAAALEGAEVSAIIANGEIQSITSLTLNNSGTQETPVIFNGGDAVIDGPLTVNADYVAVKNVTVNEDVTLTSKVENDFTAEGLNTTGELIIEDAKAPVASMRMMVANVNANGPKVNLANSSVKAINAQRNNIVITSDKKIPELKVASNVAAIKVDAAVASVAVNDSQSLQITGTGSIDKVNVAQATQLALEVKGQVKELVVANKDAKVTIGAEAKIEKLVVPADSDISTVIENYETVKDSITEVVDEGGTVVVPPVTGGEEQPGDGGNDDGNEEPGDGGNNDGGNEVDLSIADVKNISDLKTALADTKVKTINLSNDISTSEKILVTRPVSINGNDHAITFEDDAAGWNSNYIMHVYNTENVTISDIKLTGGDAALLVNSSKVKLTGTIDVSGNEFGGIESSQSAGLETMPALDVEDASFVNTSEAYTLPTIWEDKVTGTVTGTDDLATITLDTPEKVQVQYYVKAENAVDPATIATVKDVAELKTALADTKVKTIKLANDISTSEKILVNRPVSINGNDHAITFEDDAAGWNSNYIMHVYNTENVTISNIKLSGGDAGLLVNSSKVKLTGTIDVSENEFGGIESSKSSGLETMPALDVKDASFVNTSEAYTLPTIWEDKVSGTVTGTDALTKNATVKSAQVQYYVKAENAVDPATIATVKDVEELKAALADTKVKTINLTANIENVSERILVDREVTINGDGHTISFTDAINNAVKGFKHGIAVTADNVKINDLTVKLTHAPEWQGTYAVQVYDAKNVVLKNFTGTAADAAILVNASDVELTGTTTVSGNEFGGIEVSKGTVAGLENSLLTVTGTLANTTEVSGQPTIWVVEGQGEVTGNAPTIKDTVIKAGQIQYYLK